MIRISLAIYLMVFMITACTSATIQSKAPSNAQAESRLSSQKLSVSLNTLMSGINKIGFEDNSQLLGFTWTEFGLLLDVKTRLISDKYIDGLEHADIHLLAHSEKYQRLSLYVKSYVGLQFLLEKDYVRRIDVEYGSAKKQEKKYNKILKDEG